MMWTMPHLALVQHNLFVMAAGEAPSQLCCARDLPDAMLAAIYYGRIFGRGIYEDGSKAADSHFLCCSRKPPPPGGAQCAAAGWDPMCSRRQASA